MGYTGIFDDGNLDKKTYDTNNSGKVDIAESLDDGAGGSVTWEDIQEAIEAGGGGSGSGVDWQNSVLSIYDPTPNLPVGPSDGDRYIASATANGWTTDYIYTYDLDTVSWVEVIPDEGFALTVEDENKIYIHNGSTWVLMATLVSHSNLDDLDANDHPQYMAVLDYDSGEAGDRVDLAIAIVDGAGSKTYSDISGEIDSDITAHAGNASAHHAKYTDGEAALQVTKDNLGTNGDIGTGSDQVAQGDHTHSSMGLALNIDLNDGNNPFVSKSAVNYTTLNRFVFPGSTFMTPSDITAIIWTSNGSRGQDIMIYDFTNAVVIAQKLNITDVLPTMHTLPITGVIPAGKAMWEVQVRYNSQSAAARVSSVLITS